MSWIVTATGVEFELLNPKPEQVFLEDIVASLPRLARFSGHTRGFYSVAQHCVEGAKYCDSHHMLEWLLHDAHEAYVGDLAGPLKAHCPEFCRVESLVERAVRERFGLPAEMSPFVKDIDLRMLATEKRDLMPQAKSHWPCLKNRGPFDAEIVPAPMQMVASTFERLVRQWLPAAIRKEVCAS